MNKILAQGILAASLLSGIDAAQAAVYKTCSVSGGCVNGSSNISVSSNYTQTKYPLVFAHGMAGFSKVGPVDYWYGIPKDLVSGGSNVFVTQVASFQSSEVRGEQLLTQVKQILAITGAAKVNLIGHSHGNQSIRYVAAAIPTKVASVTGVGGPQTGSPVADVIKGVTTIPGLGPLTGAVLSGAINGFFLVIDAISGQGYRQDALAGMDSLTTAGAGVLRLVLEVEVGCAVRLGLQRVVVRVVGRFRGAVAVAALLVVLEAQERIVGCLSAEGGRLRSLRHVVSLGISVARNERNRGLGSQLLTSALDWAAATGIVGSSMC